MNESEQLAERYPAVWMKPDPERRRRMIADLWTEDGTHILQPPQEMCETAASAGVGTAASLEVRGHAELEARVASAYEHWVATAGLSFRRGDDVYRLHDVVTCHWEADSPDGEVTAVALEFLVLAADGRIARDYVFIES